MLLLSVLGGCRREGTATEPQGKPQRVLGPAVAGMFYPKDKEALAKKVDELLAAAKAEPIENLRALVCPHAGYEFSGSVAAKGFKQLAGRKFATVIILGPSHTSLFHGVAVADADAVETPLGQIPISPKAAKLGELAHSPCTPSARSSGPTGGRVRPSNCRRSAKRRR